MSPAVAVDSLRAKLLDQSLDLPQRFRVLFSLRGVATSEAADALLAGTGCCCGGSCCTVCVRNLTATTACARARAHAGQRSTTPRRCAGTRLRLRWGRCRRVQPS
jgi:hypothetical protein